MLPGGTQARSWTRQYSIIRFDLGALVHRGYTLKRGWGKIGGMGSGPVPDPVIGRKPAQDPLQSAKVCCALFRLSAISSCVAHASHSASAYRIAPPASFPHSRGFRQCLSNSVTGHFRPWPGPMCDRPTNTWLPHRGPPTPNGYQLLSLSYLFLSLL